jgi:hypothetical protein
MFPPPSAPRGCRGGCPVAGLGDTAAGEEEEEEDGEDGEDGDATLRLTTTILLFCDAMIDVMGRLKFVTGTLSRPAPATKLQLRKLPDPKNRVKTVHNLCFCLIYQYKSAN